MNASENTGNGFADAVPVLGPIDLDPEVIFVSSSPWHALQVSLPCVSPRSHQKLAHLGDRHDAAVIGQTKSHRGQSPSPQP